MDTYTVSVRFGTAKEWAETSTACEDIERALAVATHAAREQWGSPLLAIRIEAGDHAPRLSNGAWVYPPRCGWEA